LSGAEQREVIKEIIEPADLQSRWKSWLDNYDQKLPDTIPAEQLS
jgi:hypothetical protein